MVAVWWVCESSQRIADSLLSRGRKNYLMGVKIPRTRKCVLTEIRCESNVRRHTLTYTWILQTGGSICPLCVWRRYMVAAATKRNAHKENNMRHTRGVFRPINCNIITHRKAFYRNVFQLYMVTYLF